MSAIASALAWSNRHSVRSMAAVTSGVQARYLAEGALQLVYTNLLQINPMERLLGDGEIFHILLQGGEVRVQLTDENGKVDINRATVPLLARLLYSLDVDPSQADAIADAIADYRDEDDLRHLNGAEDADYKAAGLTRGAKDADFTSTDELRYVMGMDESLLRKILPHVTVHSRQQGINPEVASLPVLIAVSGESNFSLQMYVEQRRKNHVEGLPLPQAPSIDRRFLTRARGVTYNLTAVGFTKRGGSAGLDTTIQLRRSRRGGVIQTLEWQPYLTRGTRDNLLRDRLEERQGPS